MTYLGGSLSQRWPINLRQCPHHKRFIVIHIFYLNFAGLNIVQEHFFNNSVDASIGISWKILKIWTVQMTYAYSIESENIYNIMVKQNKRLGQMIQ